MLNISVINELIEDKYSDIESRSERILKLSEDSNVSYVYIHRMMNEKNLSLEHLILLQNVLKFSFDEVIKKL